MSASLQQQKNHKQENQSRQKTLSLRSYFYRASKSARSRYSFVVTGFEVEPMSICTWKPTALVHPLGKCPAGYLALMGFTTLSTVRVSKYMQGMPLHLLVSPVTR